ncbi:MAG: hypothetical protein Q4D85_00740 [Corynebacterium sp.]|uniref:DUF6882 domain-containing protein n=1 Tax=Corynebacterium sp. TaxID=1720 RepID=UPI0026DA89AD|nr:DUF6882 domain-containing protein [Corynebacterium sp.]MDO5097253.1 hypothetical protein [Corynebacterium sp.]
MFRLRGTITEVEYNPQGDGYEVVLHYGKETQVFDATVIARIDADRTTWSWVEEPQFGFLGTWPSDDMIAAARTLHNNGPSFLVPQTDGSTDVVLIDRHEFPALHPRTALCVGLAAMPETMDIQRAILAFSAVNQLSIHVDDDTITFEDGTVVDLKERRVRGQLSFRDVVADAFYFSAEHQLFFDGNYPAPLVAFQPETSTLIINDSVTAHGILVGTITDNVFRWADEPVLRQFAVDNGVSEFLRTEIPVSEAAEMGLDCAAKRILRHWTHVFVQLDDDTTALVLADGPTLRLPAKNMEATQAVLAIPTPPHVDHERAVASYHQLRG